MRGTRLPGGFDNVDAECYAILQELRATYDRAMAEGTDPANERLLVFCDCAGVVSQVEAAYRTHKDGVFRSWQRGAVLEAICDYRDKLGLVVVMWVPSHEGVAPNAYADAIAKGALAAQKEASLTEGVADHVRSRPCIYERDRGFGEGWELWDRPTFRGARLQADE